MILSEDETIALTVGCATSADNTMFVMANFRDTPWEAEGVAQSEWAVGKTGFSSVMVPAGEEAQALVGVDGAAGRLFGLVTFAEAGAKLSLKVTGTSEDARRQAAFRLAGARSRLREVIDACSPSLEFGNLREAFGEQ